MIFFQEIPVREPSITLIAIDSQNQIKSNQILYQHKVVKSFNSNVNYRNKLVN
jgi:hypothetical protein